MQLGIRINRILAGALAGISTPGSTVLTTPADDADAAAVELADGAAGEAGPETPDEVAEGATDALAPEVVAEEVTP